MKTIPLVKPIKRGDAEITELQLRTLDNAGDLRGIKLANVEQFDIDTILVILKRLSLTPLSPDEMSRIGPADIVTIAGEIADFFRHSPTQSQMTS